MRSWWYGTPWKDILSQVKAAFTPAQLEEWLKRPDVVERMNQKP